MTEVEALIEETREYLARRPLGPPILNRMRRLLQALESEHHQRQDGAQR